MIDPDNDSAAVDSSIVKTCKGTIAQRRGKNGEYKDNEILQIYPTSGHYPTGH